MKIFWYPFYLYLEFINKIFDTNQFLIYIFLPFFWHFPELNLYKIENLYISSFIYCLLLFIIYFYIWILFLYLWYFIRKILKFKKTWKIVNNYVLFFSVILGIFYPLYAFVFWLFSKNINKKTIYFLFIWNFLVYLSAFFMFNYNFFS